MIHVSNCALAIMLPHLTEYQYVKMQMKLVLCNVFDLPCYDISKVLSKFPGEVKDLLSGCDNYDSIHLVTLFYCNLTVLVWVFNIYELQ